MSSENWWGRTGTEPERALPGFPGFAPTPGRTYTSARRVRLGDVLPTGRIRLDALARYLQDVAVDDVRDAGIEGEVAWVVRRTAVSVRNPPRYNEPVDLVTWCSGSGPAWAERRTVVSTAGGAAVGAVSLWVCLDPLTSRPTQLPDHFFTIYGEQARRRSVKTRLVHPGPPPITGSGVSVREWPLRSADIDVLGHVNNAVGWAAVEEEMEQRAPGQLIDVGEMEYRAAIDPGTRIQLISELAGRQGAVWVVTDGGVPMASARVRLASPATSGGEQGHHRSSPPAQ